MTYCHDAFKNVYIEEFDELKLAPCCLVTPVTATNTVDFFKDPSLIKIRTDFLNGVKPVECRSCWHKEANNTPSRRQGSNQWYEDNQLDSETEELIRIDYWVGNTCNLKCVMCSPRYSSTWQQEVGITPTTRFYNNHFWENLDLSSIKYVHFSGGEPLLSKAHVEFLRNIPNKNLVHIAYNTNGTILPDRELLDLWAEFKLVQIDFSIDDIEDRFEYIRFPAKWEEVKSNLFTFRDICPVNVMFAINTTITVLNIFTYPTLVNWCQNNFATNKVTDPIDLRWQWAGGHLNCKTMPESAKQTLLDIYTGTGLEHVVNTVEFIDNDTTMEPKLAFLRTLELKRHNSYSQAFSFLNKYN